MSGPELPSSGVGGSRRTQRPATGFRLGPGDRRLLGYRAGDLPGTGPPRPSARAGEQPGGAHSRGGARASRPSSACRPTPSPWTWPRLKPPPCSRRGAAAGHRHRHPGEQRRDPHVRRGGHGGPRSGPTPCCNSTWSRPRCSAPTSAPTCAPPPGPHPLHVEHLGEPGLSPASPTTAVRRAICAASPLRCARSCGPGASR